MNKVHYNKNKNNISGWHRAFLWLRRKNLTLIMIVITALVLVPCAADAAIPIIENYTFNATTNGVEDTDITLSKPSGLAVGDLCLVFVSSDSDEGPNWNLKTGWNRIVNVGSNGPNAVTGIYWRIADGTEGSTETFTQDPEDDLMGYWIRISGVDTTDPIHNISGVGEGSGYDHDIIGHNTTKDDVLALWFLSFDGADFADEGGTITGSGWTDFIHGGTAGESSYCIGGGWGRKNMASQGPTGTVNVDGDHDDGAAYAQVSINPSAGATTTIGDGASPADNSVLASSTNNAVDAFTLSTDTEPETVTALTVSFTGTDVSDVASSGVKIWDDSTGGTPNEWDAGDTEKGSASFSGPDASVTVSISVDSSATQYLVTYDIAPGATVSNTLQGAITGATVTNTLVNNDTTDATLTISCANCVNLIGSWGTGLSHTKPSGSNRALIFIAGCQVWGDAPTLTSVTYGTQSLTKISDARIHQDNHGHVEVWMLDEAGIDAASTSTFVPTWNGDTSDLAYSHAFFSGVHQTNPIYKQATDITGSITPNPVTTVGLDTNNSDMVVVAAGAFWQSGTYAPQNGFIEGNDQQVGDITLGTAYKAASGATEMPSMTHSDASGTLYGQVIAGIVLRYVDSPVYTEGRLLGWWRIGLTHPAEAGSDRVLIFVAAAEKWGTTPVLNSLTYGGQSLSRVDSVSAEIESGTSNDVTLEIWILKEAGIAAASGDTFSPTWNDSMDKVIYSSAFFSGVDQTTPTGAKDTNSGASPAPNPITTTGLSTTNGDMVITAAASCWGADKYTPGNGFIEGNDHTAYDDLTLGTAYKEGTGAAETPSMENSDYTSDLTGQVISGVVIQTANPPTITIGDGSSPDNKDVVPNSTNNAVNAFTLSTDGGTDTVTALTVTFSGTAVADVASSGVKIYDDSTGGTPNEWDAGDTLKGTASFSGDTASVTVSISVDSSATQYLVTYDIASGVTATNTLQGAITDATVTNKLVNNDTTDATLTVISAVELAGSWVTGTTHTAETGSDRVLILVGTIAGYGDGDATISSASYGGQPLTFIESRASSGNYDSVTEVWYLNEAGIAAAVGSTFSVTWAGDPTGERYMSGFYTGVNQTTPIGAQAENYADAATPNPITTSALSNSSGDIVIVAAGGNGRGSYTAQNGFTEQQEDFWDDGDDDCLVHTVADKAATGSDETPSIQHTGMYSQQIIGFVLQVASTTIGDGASPASKNVAPDSTNNAVDAFTLVTDSEPETVTALTVTFSGTTSADVASSGVKIYEDNGSIADEWDDTDTLKGTASFSGSTANVTVSISVDDSATQYLVTYDIATGATLTNTLQGAITDATVTNKLVNNDTNDATLTISSCTFLYRKEITIQSSEVIGSADHENFPMLVSLSGDWLKTTTADATNGRIENSDGHDIIFRDMNLEQLDHEIEDYDGSVSGGTLVAWVRIPTLYYNTDTVIYMYYGNPCIDSSTENIAGVWDDNYVGVWHLDESPANTVAGHDDSTGNPNDGTPQNFGTTSTSTTDPARDVPTWSTDSKIDGADVFDESDDYVDVGNLQSLAGSSELTMSVWFNARTLPSTDGDNYGLFIQHDDWDEQMGMRFDGNSSLLDAYVETGGVATGLEIDYSGNIVINTWCHAVLTFKDGVSELFLDGVSKGTDDASSSFTTLPDLINNMFIGSLDQGSSDYFGGIIDEVRISDTARLAGWIQTEHNNQKENSIFFIEGDEDDLGDCSYSFFKPITIESDEVFGTSDHTDFPFLVNIASDNDLRTIANNGDVENIDGYDIIFRDSYGRQLDHEIEQYEPTSGKFVAWVRIPTLSLSVDTVIYMYYGNSCISSSQQNIPGVWNTNYKAVWHLDESPANTVAGHDDSTGNPNDGTPQNFGTTSTSTTDPATDVLTWSTDSKIDGADVFDGSDDYISIAAHSSLDLSTNFTVSAWFYKNIAGGENIIYASGTTNTQYWTIRSEPADKIEFNVDGTGGWESSTAIGTGAWHHMAVVKDGDAGTNMSFYVDGEPNGTATVGSVPAATGQTRTIGYRPEGSDFYWGGIIDEVRISDTARLAGWIKTCYYNQKASSSFYIVGDETSYAPTAVDLISFTATGQDESVLVEWETAQEIDNLGFNLFRSSDPYGSYTKLNSSLIPGLISSVSGQQYTYLDTNVTRSVLYYYMLEDLDLSGTRTMHGPVCVDWDADGIPDDNDEQADDGSDEDTGDSDPEVRIPEFRLYEVDFGPEGWTPSSSYASWVKLSSFSARQGDEGIALEWETSFEVDNFGFHVYREVGGKFYRITPDLVPGSVFKVGAGSELPAGQSYMYWDGLSEGTGGELYWLDCVDLNGGRASFGPIKPEIYGQPVFKRLKVRFNSITRHQISRARALGKARELREELSTKPVQTQSSTATFRMIDPENHSEPRLQPNEEQWALAAQPGVKIYVKEDGWYRVGEPELVAAGLSPGVDPRYLQLYADGEEKSMMVTGSDDGRFDPLDAVEFYGTGLDTSFTAAHVYWLVAGSRPGRRVDTPFIDIRLDLGKRMRVPRGLRGRGAPLSFPFPMELKERTFYFAALKNGEGENFFGSLISIEPVDQLLTIAHPDLSSPEDAVLEVVLQGATDSTHQIKVLFNYVEVGELGFSRQEREAFEIQIPYDLLLEGDNIVTLTAQGGPTDVSLVDKIRLTYWRKYTADEDVFQFKTSGGEWLSIGGFSSSEIQVVDITDPMRMINIRGKVMTQDSGYAITVKVPSAGERTLLAFTEESIKQPAGIEANLASSWHEISQGAEVIIIGHSDLLENVEFLKQLREQQGWSVVLVDVEDLYDEFNFGAKSPWALKDFLGRAYQYWNPQPRFVLLVGDTSYDPRNYLGYGEFDLVPTKFVDTEHLTTASDDWFVDFDDDGLPEMAVGRLPVESAEEAATVVSKIIAFESVAGLMNEALLVADINDSIDFEGASADVAGEMLAGSMEVSEILRGRSATARSDLLDLLNQGQLLVNYVGHGSTRIWNGNLLTSSDAWNLTNSPYLPFLVSMTCLNGFFQDPYSESLAETFLKAERGGAVAVWTSSGLTLPTEQTVMNLELIRLLFNGEGLTIGEAVMRAKQVVNNEDIRRTWILFGDPTLRLR